MPKGKLRISTHSITGSRSKEARGSVRSYLRSVVSGKTPLRGTSPYGMHDSRYARLVKARNRYNKRLRKRASFTVQAGTHGVG